MSWLLSPAADTINLGDLKNVTITGVASGETITWNGTAWVNSVPGAVGATPLIVIADINTSTPPTTEAVTGIVQIMDNDESDILATMGFLDASNLMSIRNAMRDGNFLISVKDSGGTNRIVFEANPGTAVIVRGGPGDDVELFVNSTERALRGIANGTTELFHNGTVKLSTTSTGVTISGDVNPTTVGNITTANLVDKTASEVITGAREWQGNVGFYSTTPIAQQTGVAVTAAGIHAALVNLGLITA